MFLNNLLSKSLNAIKAIVPIAFAGALAIVQAIGEHQEAKMIEDMDLRIAALENQNEES